MINTTKGILTGNFEEFLNRYGISQSDRMALEAFHNYAIAAIKSRKYDLEFSDEDWDEYLANLQDLPPIPDINID